MTRQLYDEGKEFTEFSKWIRKHPRLDSIKFGLSINDLDYIIHKYNDHKYIKIQLIEEKRFDAKQKFSQRDSHNIMHQAFKIANGSMISTGRGDKILKYFGYHIITFERSNPEDGKIYLNDKIISKNNLIRFLKFKKIKEE